MAIGDLDSFDYENTTREIMPKSWVNSSFNKPIERQLASDRVHSPSHYTSGRMEAIDIIEDAIAVAPNPNQGFLQGQVLKYVLRLWLKDDPQEDAKKARWYLDRLIEKMCN